MIKQLVKLANNLDERGLSQEADYLDGIIRKLSNFDNEAVIIAYHGSSDENIEGFDAGFLRSPNDLYGANIGYFTSSLKVAESYANYAGSRTGDSPILYKVALTFEKLFDISSQYNAKPFAEKVGYETFARAAGLFDRHTSEWEAYVQIMNIKRGRATLTGHKIWGAISKNNTMSKAGRRMLLEFGYDGIRYNGGEMVTSLGIQHDVYVPFKKGSISIMEKGKSLT